MPLELPDLEMAAPPVTVTPPAEISIQGTTREEQLASLRRQAGNWQPARSLGTLRETMVFATGNPEARVMLIGEAPGYQEEKEGEPFVGPAGQKLDDILKAMGLSREEVYISNIVKFRPGMARQTTNNRKPTPEEMEVCLPFVRAEISIVKPERIIALGDSAAEVIARSEWQRDLNARPLACLRRHAAAGDLSPKLPATKWQRDQRETPAVGGHARRHGKTQPAHFR